MALGIPSELAPSLFAQALSRLLFVYGAFSMILAEILLLLMGWHEGNAAVAWAGFLVGFPGFILWRMMFASKSWLLGLSFLLSLGAVLGVVSFVVLTTVPTVESTQFYPFALISFALLMVCGLDARVWERLGWLVAGFLVANIALFFSASLATSEFEFDYRLLIGFVVVGIAVSLTPRLLALNTKLQVDLDESSHLIEQESVRQQVTRVATATLHDTLLANLSLLTQTKPGVLQPELRDALEAQLAQIHVDDWLTSVVVSPSEDSALRESYDQRIADVINHAQAQGLTVHLSGDLEGLIRLSPEAVEALTGSLSQCLTNVEKHSGQSSVEVVILSAGEYISVTVIDTGHGFDPEAIPEDRMGIRLSVQARVESVGGRMRIWSNPETGTAVMLQIPISEGV